MNPKALRQTTSQRTSKGSSAPVLSPLAVFVREHADGRHPVPELADMAASALSRLVRREDVFHACDELADQGLLEKRIAPPAGGAAVNRHVATRSALQIATVAAATAVTLLHAGSVRGDDGTGKDNKVEQSSKTTVVADKKAAAATDRPAAEQNKKDARANDVKQEESEKKSARTTRPAAVQKLKVAGPSLPAADQKDGAGLNQPAAEQKTKDANRASQPSLEQQQKAAPGAEQSAEQRQKGGVTADQKAEQKVKRAPGAEQSAEQRQKGGATADQKAEQASKTPARVGKTKSTR